MHLRLDKVIDSNISSIHSSIIESTPKGSDVHFWCPRDLLSQLYVPAICPNLSYTMSQRSHLSHLCPISVPSVSHQCPMTTLLKGKQYSINISIHRRFAENLRVWLWTFGSCQSHVVLKVNSIVYFFWYLWWV